MDDYSGRLKTSPFFHLARAVAYALTSLVALLSGSYSSELEPGWSAAALGLWLGSWYFFVAYAVCFDYQEGVDPALSRQARNAGVGIGIGMQVLLLLFVVVEALSVPSLWWLVPLYLGYFVLFTSYGWRILRRYEGASQPPARHQLAWPTLISVGLAYYVGRCLAVGALGWPSVTVVAVVLSYFLLTELTLSKFPISKWPRRLLVTSSIVGCLAITAWILVRRLTVPQTSWDASVALALFCISVSAYLGHFEAWRVTAHVIAREMAASANGGRPGQRPVGHEYQVATTAVLVLTMLILPFVYIFGDFGFIFVAGFAAHASVSFAYWIKQSPADLRSGPWAFKKTIFGVVFLLVVWADSHWHLTWKTSAFKPIVTSEMIALVILVTGILTTPLLRETFRRARRLLSRDGGLSQLFVAVLGVKDNWARMLILTSLFGLWASKIVANASSDAAVSAKAQQAFAAYILFIGTAVWCVLASWARRRPLTALAGVVLGICMSARVPTALGLLVMVAVPLRDLGIGSAVLAGMVFSLTASAGFLINDVCDSERDRLNKPWRAIPSGRLSRTQAVASGAVASFVSALLVLTAYSTGDAFLAVTGVVALASVLLYPLTVLMFPYAKNVLAATACVMPLIYSLRRVESQLGVAVVAAAGAFLLGREILMDVLDLKGDLKTGVVTLAARVGPAIAAVFSASLLLTGTLLLDVTTRSQFPWATTSLCVTGLAVALLGVRYGRAASLRLAPLLLWLPMAVGWAESVHAG